MIKKKENKSGLVAQIQISARHSHRTQEDLSSVGQNLPEY